MIHFLQTTDPIFYRDPFNLAWLPLVSERLFVAIVATALLASFVSTWIAATRESAAHLQRWIVLSAAVIVCLAQISMLNVMIEDAFITFRHADHWASGVGLTWNPGERVEGMTSLLWAIVLGIARAAGAPPLLAARIIGVTSAVLSLVVIERLTAHFVRRKYLAPIAALAVAMNPYFATHAAGGLETALFTLLVGLGYLSLITRRVALASVLLAFAVLARPDGIVFWVAAVAYELVQDRGQWKRTLGLLGVPFVVIFGASEFWRIAYYRDVVPNSVRAKSGLGMSALIHGVKYAWAFVDAELLLPGAVIIAAAAWLRRHSPRELFPLGLVVVGCAAYSALVVAVGGDWMPGFRYLVPVAYLLVPPLIFAVDELSHALVTHWRLGPKAIAATTVCLALVFPGIWVLDSLQAFRPGLSFPLLRAKDPLQSSLKAWHQREVDLAQIGLWMHQVFPPQTWLACLSSGALPYYADLPTIDMFGLSDRHIATVAPRPARAGHTRRDDPYVFERAPDIIYIENGFRMQAPKTYETSPLQRVSSHVFHEQYDIVVLELLPQPSSVVPDRTTSRWASFYVHRRDRPILEALQHTETTHDCEALSSSR